MIGLFGLDEDCNNNDSIDVNHKDNVREAKRKNFDNNGDNDDENIGGGADKDNVMEAEAEDSWACLR